MGFTLSPINTSDMFSDSPLKGWHLIQMGKPRHIYIKCVSIKRQTWADWNETGLSHP